MRRVGSRVKVGAANRHHSNGRVPMSGPGYAPSEGVRVEWERRRQRVVEWHYQHFDYGLGQEGEQEVGTHPREAVTVVASAARTVHTSDRNGAIWAEQAQLEWHPKD